MDQQYYHYQCGSCYCTISADYLPEGEEYIWVLDGSLCSSCESEEEEFYYDDDDD